MIRITETDLGTGIPYASANREAGARNFGYFDLKRFPHLVHEIPELRDAPGLFESVKLINVPDSVFRTLGCNWQSHRAYVHLAFEILHWNQSKTAFHRLANDFSKWHALHFSDPCVIDMEFRIGPVSYHDRGVRGWAMSIHLMSMESQNDVVEMYLNRLTEFLSLTSERLQPQLHGCQTTLSDFARPFITTSLTEPVAGKGDRLRT